MLSTNEIIKELDGKNTRKGRTVKEVLQAQNEEVQNRIKEYQMMARKDNTRTEARYRAAAYLQALCDVGIITVRERQQLFIYTTV